MMDYSNELAELQEELNRARRHAADTGTLGGTQENGTRITSLSRTFRDDVQELRIYLQEYEGNPVIQIGTWKGDEAGRWFIVPNRQCRIRRSEIMHVIEALLRIARILNGEEPGWSVHPRTPQPSLA
jgi:hypothetical protein